MLSRETAIDQFAEFVCQAGTSQHSGNPLRLQINTPVHWLGFQRGGRTRVLLPDLAENVAKFARRDIFEPLAPVGELLVDLDGRLLHDRMGLFGSAAEQEIVPLGDPLMTVVGVEGQAQQGGFFDDARGGLQCSAS